MAPITITLFQVRETKNTVRYEAPAPADGAPKVPVDTLYVQKTALPKPAPQRISITVEAS